MSSRTETLLEIFETLTTDQKMSLIETHIDYSEDCFCNLCINNFHEIDKIWSENIKAQYERGECTCILVIHHGGGDMEDWDYKHLPGCIKFAEVKT